MIQQQVVNNIMVSENVMPDEVKDFLSWFEKANNEYSPGGIKRIFGNSIPENIESPKG